MSLLKDTADLFTSGSNRRRTPRLTCERPLHAEVLAAKADIEITDVGFGGIGVRSTAPFWPGARHIVRLTAGRGTTIELPSKVVHCRRAVTDCGAPCYIVGWEFLPSDSNDDSIMRLMDLVAGVGPFDLVS